MCLSTWSRLQYYCKSKPNPEKDKMSVRVGSRGASVANADDNDWTFFIFYVYVAMKLIRRIGSVPIRCVKNFNKEQKETHVYWRCLYELVQHLFGWLIKNYAINTSLMSSTNGRLPSFLSYVANDKENVSHSLNCRNNKDLTLYVPSFGWV